MAEINGIEIELQDFLFRIIPLQLHCQRQFLQLSGHGAVIGKENVLHRLLGNGASPFQGFSCHGIGDESPGHADDIHSSMVVVPPILGGNDAFLQKIRYFVIGHKLLPMHPGLQGLPEMGHIVPFLPERTGLRLFLHHRRRRGGRRFRLLLHYPLGRGRRGHTGNQGGHRILHFRYDPLFLLFRLHWLGGHGAAMRSLRLAAQVVSLGHAPVYGASQYDQKK